jgi:CRP-like cAMP-binding protein
MSNDALVAPLLRVELFRGLKPAQLVELARRAERIVFKAGDTIVTEDQSGDSAYLIVSGLAQIVADVGHVDKAGSSTTITTATELPVVEGSLIGEMAMLVDHDYAATVRATTHVRALRFSRVRMYGLMERDPSLAAHFTAKVTERLHLAAHELRQINDMLGDSDAVFALANDDETELVAGLISRPISSDHLGHAAQDLGAPILH